MAMFVAMPFRAGFADTALLAVVHLVGRHPAALTETVPVAMEIIRVAIAQGTTEQLKFKALTHISILLPFPATGPLPGILPLLECIGVLPDSRPRCIVV